MFYNSLFAGWLLLYVHYCKKALSSIIKRLRFRLAVGLDINHMGKMGRIDLILAIYHYSSGLNLAKPLFS